MDDDAIHEKNDDSTDDIQSSEEEKGKRSSKKGKRMASPDNWQLTMQGIAAKGKYVLENGQWSDCQFLVNVPPNQEIVKAHKLFLSMSSPVFETMFFGSIPEMENPIKIPEIQPETFKALLKFIYTDELVLTQFEDAQDLYYCAKKYMMPDLVAKCRNYIRNNLSPEKVCKAYEFSVFYEEAELKEMCLRIIQLDTKKVVTAASWEDAQLNTVFVIFEQNILSIDSEMELYDALLVWAKAECGRKDLPCDQKSMRSVTGDLLTEIRFLTLTSKQFAEGPGKVEILDKDEVYAIIMNISSTNSSIPMPTGFSPERNPRYYLSINLQQKYLNLETQREQKFCCRRLLTRTSVCRNNGNLDCSLTFRVDTSIQMVGLLVSTQLLTSAAAAQTYNEVLYAYLLDSEGMRAADTHFTSEATFDSTVKICFNRPAKIARDKIYRIGVVFNKPGTYPLGESDSSINCVGVNFSFCVGPCNASIRDSLIRGITFLK